MYKTWGLNPQPIIYNTLFPGMLPVFGGGELPSHKKLLDGIIDSYCLYPFTPGSAHSNLTSMYTKSKTKTGTGEQCSTYMSQTLHYYVKNLWKTTEMKKLFHYY